MHRRAGLHPEPGPRCLVPRSDPDPGVRAVHHRRASSSPCSGASAGSSPAAVSRARSPTSRCSRCRSGWSAAGSTTWPPTGTTYFGPGGDPIDALKIWQGGLGIWGAVALGAVGRLDRLPPARGAAAVLRRRGRARDRHRAGHRAARQLVQPGAVRRPDHAAVGPGDLPPGRPGDRRAGPARRCRARPHPDRGRAPDVPLRAAVEPARRRRSWCGPTAGSGSGTAARSRVYVAGYTRGPVLDRADAHRPRRRGCSATSGSTWWSPASCSSAPSPTCCWCASRGRCRRSRRAARAPPRCVPGRPPAHAAESAGPAAVEPDAPEARRAARRRLPRGSHRTGRPEPHPETGVDTAEAFTGFGEGAVEFYDGLLVDNSQGLLDRPPRGLRERRARPDAGAARRRWSPSSARARSSGPTATCGSPATRRRTRPHCGATVGPFYVQIGADGLLAAGGYYQMAPDQVGRFRTAVDDERRGDDLRPTRLAARRGRRRSRRRRDCSRPARAASTPTTRGWTCCGTSRSTAGARWAPDDVLHEAARGGAGGRGVAGAPAAARSGSRPRRRRATSGATADACRHVRPTRRAS